MYAHRFSGHHCHAPYAPAVYAARRAISLTAARETAAQIQAECDIECRTFDECKAESGTGRKSLRGIADRLATEGRISKGEAAMVRRAIDLDKDVPAALLEEVTRR